MFSPPFLILCITLTYSGSFCKLLEVKGSEKIISSKKTGLVVILFMLKYMYILEKTHSLLLTSENALLMRCKKNVMHNDCCVDWLVASPKNVILTYLL